MMIKVAIVEDDDIYIGQLLSYIDRFVEEKKQEIRVTVYHDGDEILEGYKSEFDIILLDIQMRFVDGMTAAEEIRRMDHEVVIMFITNMEQYAVRGYQVDALDYVVKPVEYQAFSRKLERAITRAGRRDRHFIPLQTAGSIQKVEVSQIRYVESQGHNMHVNTLAGEYICRMTMQQAEEQLSPFGFYRCGKGYLVNLDKVDSFLDGICRIGSVSIPVSRARRKEFLEALTDYISRS